MKKWIRFIVLVAVFFGAVKNDIIAQEVNNKADTFFLTKKKGLLGRLGKSISTSGVDEEPQKVENQFLKYKGKIIRSIELLSLGFERNIYDTNLVKYNFGIGIANVLHKNSKEKVLRRNLFFKETDRLYPYLIADNERYLRDLTFIQDARIIVEFAEGSIDSVDVVVITKDIFSLGAKLKADDRTRGRLELEEENFAGSATKILLSGLYDEPRRPVKAFGAELTKRNIGGSFIDWTIGFSNYATAFNSGRREETNMFTRWEKPLVTPYIPSTGALEAGYYKTSNAYVSDSVYLHDFRYEYYNIDGWLGYSMDSRRAIYANKEIKVHNFIALRGFNRHFFKTPARAIDTFNYSFTNSTGILASINVFKQTFYKTNFIYGFGRNEDVPEGFSAVLTGGYAIQQNKGYAVKENIKRPYSGIDFTLTHFNKKGFFTSYTLKAGSFYNRKRFEDADVLINVDHFTKIRRLTGQWYQRIFISAGITAQINPVFNTPLYLNSNFGLPYFNPESTESDLRSTLKLESVFYNTKKILGFRFAPFVFTDFSAVKPIKENFDKSNLFSALGGGVRTRNENLVFGTIELKGYYFPRTNGDMKDWKVELNTNVRFKYNSSFIKRPGYIVAN
jgi:hypothetical protein